MEKELDQHDMMVLRDFLGENWRAFSEHCKLHGTDAQDIYEKVGGEPE